MKVTIDDDPPALFVPIVLTLTFDHACEAQAFLRNVGTGGMFPLITIPLRAALSRRGYK